MRGLLCALTLLCVTPLLRAQQLPVNVWTGASSNQWENPGNWSLGHVPNGGEDADINGGNVVATGAVVFNALYLRVGSLRASGDITALVATVNAGATLTLASDSARTIQGSIICHGLFVWEGGDIAGLAGGLHPSYLYIASEGTFEDRANKCAIRTNCVFSNFGVYKKTGGGSEIRTLFNCGGRIDVGAGSLLLSVLRTGFGPFRFDVSAGATCHAIGESGSPIVLYLGTELRGAGDIILEGRCQGWLVGHARFRNRFGGPNFTIEPGSTAIVAGEPGSICPFSGDVHNRGTLIWQAGSIGIDPEFPQPGEISNGGLFENQAGSDCDFSSAGFTNFGILRHLGPGSATVSFGRFSNYGTVEVTSGKLAVANLTSSDGTVNVALGAMAELHAVDYTAYLATGTQFLGSGEIVLNGNFFGTFQGKARLHDFFDGALTIPDGSTLTIAETTGAALRLHGSITNNGTILWSGGDIVGNPAQPTGRISNEASGILEARSDGSFGPDLALANNGFLGKTAGTGTTLINAGLINHGTIEVQSGTLSFARGVEQDTGETRLSGATLRVNAPYLARFGGGTLSGAGTLGGEVQMTGGIIRPGNAVGGPLHIAGQLTLGISTTTEIIARGPHPAELGRIVVDGPATVSGTLTFSLANGFLPSATDCFPFLSATSLVGSFTASVLPPATTDGAFAINYANNSVTVSVFPSTFGTWKRSCFGSETDPTIVGDQADPDADGVPNLLEYAFGLEPLIASRAGLPTTTLQPATPGGPLYLTMTFTMPATVTDLDLTPQVSGDLADWLSGPGWTETISDTTSDGVRTVIVRDTVPTSTSARRFMRLQVQVMP